ncbi:MAG TPA: hypothetical protein VF998_07510 [Candidatus Limnocylindria bacterium]
MQLNLETLVNPPFAKDPPVKIDINASTLGLIIAVLSAIGLLFSVLALPALFAASAIASVYAVGFGGIFALALIGLLWSIASSALSAWGGYRMYKLDPEGKRFAIYGLALGLVGQLITAIGYYSVGGQIVPIALTVVLYYLVVVSRFPQPAKAEQPATPQ